MYELKNEVKRFGRCSCCGSDNSVFDLIKTEVSNEVYKSVYTIQCTYCGRKRTKPYMHDLIYEWNRYGYDGDEYPDPSKRAEGNEILRESNKRLREEIKTLMARIKKLEDENMCLFKKLTEMPEPSICSGLEYLSPDELLELSKRMRQAEEGHWLAEHAKDPGYGAREISCMTWEERLV